MAIKRERITTNGSSRYIRRDSNGRFTSNQVPVGRSQAADSRQQAKADNPGGQGDRGDRRR